MNHVFVIVSTFLTPLDRGLMTAKVEMIIDVIIRSNLHELLKNTHELQADTR
ncbi:hypothetical protein GCM10010520_30880 [Rhizobium viscosum]